MRILPDNPMPLALAPGGPQAQIEQTRAALPATRIEVKLLCWRDDLPGGNLVRRLGTARNV